MSDVSIPTTTDGVVATATTFALDEHADLVKLDDFLTERIDELTKEREGVRARIQALAGDATSLTLDGREVYIYAPTAQFREAEFKKAYPNMWKACVKEETVEKLDKKQLEQVWPEIYRQFQSRPFKRK